MPTTSSSFDKLFPARIVSLHAAIGILWILFSDVAAGWFVKDMQQFENVAILKGVKGYTVTICRPLPAVDI